MKQTTEKNLKKLLKDLNLNPYGLATEIGKNRSIMTLYLQGKRKPNVDTCKKIIIAARKKGVDIDLFYLRPDMAMDFND